MNVFDMILDCHGVDATRERREFLERVVSETVRIMDEGGTAVLVTSQSDLTNQDDVEKAVSENCDETSCIKWEW